jgi:hypothetical protein
MESLQEFILSGRIVDLMLALVALEILVISYLFSRQGRGIASWPMLLNIGSGASLMLALRVSLTGGQWPMLAACLVAALAFHVADMALRWEAPAE